MREQQTEGYSSFIAFITFFLTGKATFSFPNFHSRYFSKLSLRTWSWNEIVGEKTKLTENNFSLKPGRLEKSSNLKSPKLKISELTKSTEDVMTWQTNVLRADKAWLG